MSCLAFFRIVLGCFLLAGAFGYSANAQTDHAQATAQHMDEDVVGIFYIDLDEFDLNATVRIAEKLGFQQQEEFIDLVESLPELSAQLEELKRSGVTRAYALLRSTDLQNQGTSWVLPLKPGSDPSVAKAAFEKIVAPLYPKQFEAIGANNNSILVAATAAQLEKLSGTASENQESTQPGATADMWAEVGKGTVGLLLFGDSNSRRVVRELLPPLSGPLKALNGRLIADELEWGGLELQLGKRPNLKFVVEARSEQVAKQLEQTLVAGNQFLQQLPQTKQYLPETEFDFVFNALAPQRTGNRITITTESLTADLDRLAKVMAPQVNLARVKAAEAKRMNNLRQLALANLNFESAHRHFPTQATVSETGQPLLSWRVQVLPFLGQKENELYQQFHLDEPWDSEHNRQLVQQMPDVFRDPSPESHQNNKIGKTIFVGPAGDGMIFRGSKELTFSDISDGTSNTILLVAVSPDHAVPWTQPSDWQIDLNHPQAQLEGNGRTKVELVMADGSTHQIPISKDLKTWQGLVQSADGTVVEW